jgi:SHS2 domain-containing protein
VRTEREQEVKQLRLSEHFEHGADVGVRGIGMSIEEAFAGAAQAVSRFVVEDPAKLGRSVEAAITCSAGGREELLVAFLNEVISLMDVRRVVFGSFDVTIRRLAGGTWDLSARARGDPFDPSRHEATVEPKGATFTELRVAEENGRWVAQCVVDV